MPPVDQDRVMDILAAAVELPAEQRAVFLDSTCAGAVELRREVDELLACAAPASAAFDAAAERIVQPDPDRIGPYEILEPIGEGGMAIVYKAQQHQPVRRIVALKLIKLGMDTRQFVARFESERQALAMMDHPNVARVYDAGSTETGRPYFVMEYVAGESLLDYCDQHNLALRQRLELFIVVCEAVEHAHRKGIIHRDLKNSNVLVAEVDGRAVPKVIDFGVAKAIQQPLSERTLQTEQGQLIGTPEYMSPEQAERGELDIDTRTDVYSLGVLLYELIAGVQPIASDLLRSGSYEQVQRIIRESEPQRPSTRLSTLASADATRIAQRRCTALPTLIRNLRSELEWIPLKAMRKDREQRYRSASELADDIHNYLDRLPLIAGPESTAYKLRKFLRRHKVGVAASAAMLILLVAGIVATAWQAIRATRAEHVAAREADAAKKQASIARSVNELMTGMISKANRGQQKGNPNVTVRAVMDAAAAELNAGTTSHEPEVEAALRTAIGQTYVELGLYDAAEPMLRRSVEEEILLKGEQSLDVARSRVDLATLLTHKGDYKAAELLYRQVLATHHEPHKHVASAMTGLGAILRSRRDYAAAEPLFRDVLAMRRKLHGDEHKEVAYGLNNLAVILQEKGEFAAAESLHHEALAMRRKLHGDESIEVAQTLSNLGEMLGAKKDFVAAESATRQGLAMNEKLLGSEHPAVAAGLNNLAALLVARGDYDGADSIYRKALELRRKLQGDDHPETLEVMSNLSFVAYKLGRNAEAEQLAREALDKATTSPSLGPEHPQTKYLARVYAGCLYALGRPAEGAAVRKEFGLPELATQPAAGTQPANTQPSTAP